MNWQPIPSVTAPHYLDTGLNAVQKCVSWYLEKTAGDFVVKSLQGYQPKATVSGNLLCRGAHFDATSGKLYSVHGNTVYDVDPATGTASALSGSLTGVGLTSHCTFASGLSQAMFVDGFHGYIIAPGAATVTKITDSNFATNPTSCACYNGQFLVTDLDSDRWKMSSVDDGLNWTPLISGRAITNGDALAHVEVVRDVAYFFGYSSIEPWYTSSVDPYLQPVTGSTMPVGVVDSTWVARNGDALYFYGKGTNGRGAFWAILGGNLTKICPPYIEDKVGDWPNYPLRAFAYTNAGSEFFEVYNDSASSNGGWLYNATSQTWSEVPTTRSLVTVRNHDAINGEPPIGFDMANGSVYWLGSGKSPYNSFNGTSISRVLDFKVDGGMSRTFHQGMRFEFEAQHDSSSSYTLSATLQKSDDAGRTFDTGITLSKAVTNGTSAQQVVLTSPPLGSFKAGRIYRLTMTGPAASLILRRAEGLVRVGRF